MINLARFIGFWILPSMETLRLATGSLFIFYHIPQSGNNGMRDGLHYYYIHPTKPGKVTIPYHNKDLKIKTVNSILKQAGLK